VGSDTNLLQVNRKTLTRTMEELGRRTLEKEEEGFTRSGRVERKDRGENLRILLYFSIHILFQSLGNLKTKNAIASVALITWLCQLAYCYKMKMHKTQSLGLVFKFQALLQLPSFKFASASILFVTEIKN